MNPLTDLADALAKDAIEAANRLNDETIITEVGRELGASSSTMQEAYQTSIRMRLAEVRAREYLEKRIADAALKEA